MYQPKYRRQDKLNPVTTHVGSNWRRIQTGVAFLLWSWSGRQRPACVRVHHSYRPRLVPAVLLLLLNRCDISDECRHKKEMEVSKFHSWLPFPFPRIAARYRNRKTFYYLLEKRPPLPSRLHVCNAIQTISFNNTAAKKYLHHHYHHHCRQYQHQQPTTVFYDRRADDR